MSLQIYSYKLSMHAHTRICVCLTTTHLSRSRIKPRLTMRARGINCDRRLLFVVVICKSLNVSSRITAKLRDRLKLHDSLPKSKACNVAVAVDAGVVALPELLVTPLTLPPALLPLL